MALFVANRLAFLLSLQQLVFAARVTNSNRAL
jgi:hypothetical protein